MANHKSRANKTNIKTSEMLKSCSARIVLIAFVNRWIWGENSAETHGILICKYGDFMQLVLSTISGIVLHQFQLFPRQTAMFFPCAQQFLLCWNPHFWWYSKLPSLLMRPPDVWSVRGFNTSMKPIVHDPKMGRENMSSLKPQTRLVGGLTPEKY